MRRFGIVIDVLKRRMGKEMVKVKKDKVRWSNSGYKGE